MLDNYLFDDLDFLIGLLYDTLPSDLHCVWLHVPFSLALCTLNFVAVLHAVTFKRKIISCHKVGLFVNNYKIQCCTVVLLMKTPRITSTKCDVCVITIV